jgi:hypothetical protein
MKKYLILLLFLFGFSVAHAQTCEEWMEYVKTESYGTTYTSYNSEAISKVTFYTVVIDYKTFYFAIVCFKKKYSYTCEEYIYQVASNTKMNYSMSYIESAGKAFWKYIQPYNDNLNCAPEMD